MKFYNELQDLLNGLTNELLRYENDILDLRELGEQVTFEEIHKKAFNTALNDRLVSVMGTMSVMRNSSYYTASLVDALKVANDDMQHLLNLVLDMTRDHNDESSSDALVKLVKVLDDAVARLNRTLVKTVVPTLHREVDEVKKLTELSPVSKEGQAEFKEQIDRFKKNYKDLNWAAETLEKDAQGEDEFAEISKRHLDDVNAFKEKCAPAIEKAARLQLHVDSTNSPSYVIATASEIAWTKDYNSVLDMMVDLNAEMTHLLSKLVASRDADMEYLRLKTRVLNSVKDARFRVVVDEQTLAVDVNSGHVAKLYIEGDDIRMRDVRLPFTYTAYGHAVKGSAVYNGGRDIKAFDARKTLAMHALEIDADPELKAGIEQMAQETQQEVELVVKEFKSRVLESDYELVIE